MSETRAVTPRTTRLHSMTGFSRAEGARGAWRWTWEVKSVNGRGLDVKLRLPQGYDGLEQHARDAIAARFKRGSIQLGLSLRKDASSTGAARLDHAFLASVIEAGEPYVLKGLVQQARWDGLLALRGAFLAEDDAAQTDDAEAAALQADIAESLAVALDGLSTARAREGAALQALLTDQIETIAHLASAARAQAATAPEALAEKLRTRIAALTAEAGVDPQRLAQEIALLAAKADVREELDRLDAHISDARALLASSDAIGRRFDFLTQEFNREANTLCSKSSDTALTRIGLDMKAAIDQLREQAANVE